MNDDDSLAVAVAAAVDSDGAECSLQQLVGGWVLLVVVVVQMCGIKQTKRTRVNLDLSTPFHTVRCLESFLRKTIRGNLLGEQ